MSVAFSSVNSSPYLFLIEADGELFGLQSAMISSADHYVPDESPENITAMTREILQVEKHLANEKRINAALEQGIESLEQGHGLPDNIWYRCSMNVG